VCACFFFSSVARLLLLLPEQGPQRHARHLHHLEADARDVADSVAAPAETGDEDLILLLVVLRGKERERGRE
jgi:hypothetical protein